MKIYHGFFSECGPRKNNEDYIDFRYMPEHNRAVFVLCDGMGGHECGEVASRFVAEHICGYWEKNPKRPDSEKKIIDACQETKIAYDNKSRVEMGTTMAMVAIEENQAILAHCGDSRIYMVRDGKIIYQSTDHVALTPEGWPIITRAFFTGRNNYNPDIKTIDVEVGDMILICSDGVYGNEKWSALKDALEGKDVYSYPLCAVEKIASENAHDNYSAILIRIGKDEPEDKTDTYLFKLNRKRKDSDEKMIPVEYFRLRREAMDRLMEMNCYSREKETYQYGVSRCTDGKGAKWITNEQK